ncbi:MAG: hypothetical protein U0R24_10110 [Solirubrobacterales bacterium]
MSVTSNVHDTAIVADMANPTEYGRLHHVAYYFDSYEDVYRAADIFSASEGADPRRRSRHPRDRASDVLLPEGSGSGHRFELYRAATRFDPDWEPLHLTEDEIVDGMVWTGERFPPGGGGPMDGTTPCPAPTPATA